MRTRRLQKYRSLVVAAQVTRTLPVVTHMLSVKGNTCITQYGVIIRPPPAPPIRCIP